MNLAISILAALIVLVPSSYALAQDIFPAALLSQYRPSSSGGGGAVGTNYWPISYTSGSGSSGNYTVGTQIVIGSTNVVVNAIGCFLPANSTATYQLGLYNSSGSLLASNTVVGTNDLSSTVMYASVAPVTLTAGATYTLASYAGGATFIQFSSSAFTTNNCATAANCTYVGSTILTWPTTLNGAGQSYGQAFIYQ